MDRKVKWINSIFFLGLLFLSIYFGKERSMLWDGSMAISSIYVHKEPIFSENRLPTIINCLFPLLISKLNFSIIWVLYAYIISYCFLPISVFVFFRFIVKNENQLTVFLISSTLFFFNGFFVASHDTITIFYYIFFPYYLLTHVPPKQKVIYYLLLGIFIAIIVFGHLSQVITLALLVGYLFISKKLKVSLWYVLLNVFLCLIVKIFFLQGDYEKDLINSFTPLLLSNINHNTVFIGFIKSCISFNIIYLVILLITVLYLIKIKEILLCFYVLVSSIIVAIFLSCFFQNSLFFSFYTEPHFKALGVLVSVVFVDFVMPKLKNIKQYISLIFIYSFFLICLFIAGIDYASYYNYVKKIGKHQKVNIFYYSKDLIYDNSQYFLPFESSVINLCENNNCHFIACRPDTTIADIESVFEYAIKKKSDFCFDDTLIIKKAPPNMIKYLEKKMGRYY